jgi:hypothetical protein
MTPTQSICSVSKPNKGLCHEIEFKYFGYKKEPLLVFKIKTSSSDEMFYLPLVSAFKVNI